MQGKSVRARTAVPTAGPDPSAKCRYLVGGRHVWLVRDATSEADRAPLGGRAM